METRQTRLYESISSRIRDLVARTNLRPGDRLPPERHLADLFQVSRNSVREAIKSLEQQGILISKAGSGTFIADQSASSLSSALERVFIRERHRLADIFELRLVLEPQIAFLAAQRITDEECDRLDAMIGHQERALAENAAYQEHDLAFHDFIAACTGNEAIAQLMEKLQDMLTESRDEALRSTRRERESLVGHRQIRQALRDRDPKRARRAMTSHLQQTRHCLFTNKGGTDE
ncbi:MAG: FadR family transcriptional regulator [Deltaproteobacteria bacterium]|nr:FadR family transcriptional regulator [Deltaproteobacteria bacterium]